MSDEWGPWIEHDGRGCPCRGEVIEAIWFCGDYESNVGEAGVVWLVPEGAGSNPRESSWWWFVNGAGVVECIDPKTAPIIRYRIRKPRGLTILEDLIADLPVRPEVDA